MSVGERAPSGQRPLRIGVEAAVDENVGWGGWRRLSGRNRRHWRNAALIRMDNGGRREKEQTYS